MSFRATIGLFLVLAALGGYVYWSEIRGKESREEAESKKDRVFDFKTEDVYKLDVLAVADEKAPVVITKDGATNWKILSPLQTEADSYAADGYVSSLMYLTYQRDVEDNPKDPGTYGLKDAKKHISIWLKGKKNPLILLIGEKSGIGNSYYAMRTDQKKVLILDASFDSSLAKGFFEFRDKKIFPIDEEKVEKIDIKREKDSLTIEKASDGTWHLTQPLNVEASKSTVEDVLRELKNLQATKFAEEELTDPKPFGFDKPQITARIEFEGSTVPADVVIGSKGTHENDLFARSSIRKPVVMVNESIFKTLAKPISEFRENHALAFDQYETQKISLIYPDKTITCAKSNETEWKLESPVKGEAEGSEVDNILYGVEGLQAKDFIDKPDSNLATYGLDKPRVRIQIWQKGDKIPREVMVGGEDKSKSLTFAKNSKFQYLYLVETSTTQSLFPKIEDLKKKPVDKSKPAEEMPKE